MSETEYAVKTAVAQLQALLGDERDPIANAANTAAFIAHILPRINWVGFYFLRDGELLLGPFQGKPACTRIPLGQGVCGTVAERGRSIMVPDVHSFPGHIACDAASRSEGVVPLRNAEGTLLGVLDVDSPEVDRFSPADRELLEALATVLGERIPSNA